MDKKLFSPIALMVCSLALFAAACSDTGSQTAPQGHKKTPQTAQQSIQPTGGETPPGTAPTATPPAARSSQCADLLTAKCTACHSMARICEKLGKKNKSRWQRTVERMTTRGAKVSAEEAATLATCLDKNGRDLQAVCQ